MIVFNDFVIDTEPKRVMTDVFIGIFIANILVNLIIIIYKTVKGLYEQYKLYIRRRKLKKYVFVDLEKQ